MVFIVLHRLKTCCLFKHEYNYTFESYLDQIRDNKLSIIKFELLTNLE